MHPFTVVIFCVILAYCHAIPSGYLLKVTHNCGTLGANKTTDGAGANVTVKTDLHAFAKLTCNDGSGLPLTVEMPPINDTNTEVTTNLYYTGDSVGVSGTDCFFFHPNGDSNVFVAKVEVFWGFRNATLMEDYETYTLTCAVDGDASSRLDSKSIDDHRILMTDGLVHTLGDEYAGSSQLHLMDVLNNIIGGTQVAMGKKVYLQLSISGGTEQGLTPYDCYAQNSDGTKSYKIFNAGCGDGIVFKKTAGFIVSGTTAKSPFFKVFKLIEGTGNIAAVKYRCSFTTCNNTCDGSSCSLPTRRRRSVDQDRSVLMAASAKYHINQPTKLNDPRKPERSPREPGQIKERRLSTVALFCVAALAILALLLSLYSCVRQERARSRDCVPRCKCPNSNICPCPECPRQI